VHQDDIVPRMSPKAALLLFAEYREKGLDGQILIDLDTYPGFQVLRKLLRRGNLNDFSNTFLQIMEPAAQLASSFAPALPGTIKYLVKTEGGTITLLTVGANVVERLELSKSIIEDHLLDGGYVKSLRELLKLIQLLRSFVNGRLFH
jgi:hypothetical protein